jgi:hypothetical protein
MDNDLEKLLAAYRPVGPPQDLRDRVIGAAAGRRPTDSARSLASAARWLPAAAALLIAVSLYALAANARDSAIVTPVVGAGEHRAELIELMTNQDGENVRTAIAYLTDLEEQWTAADAARQQAVDVEQVERD